MEIKAVLIDIDNTLLDFNASAHESIKNVAKKHSIELPEGYFDVFLRINDDLWNELEQGEITKQDIYKRRWKNIFDELKITGDSDLFEEDFRKDLRYTAIPVKGAEDILSYLSEKYPVYTASNASRYQQEVRLEKAGLSKYLSGMFASEDIGFQKPAKEFFYACCSELFPISPQNIIMIGDSVTADIIGAKNYGLQSIWFNYSNKIYDNYSFTDYYVNNLAEIKNLL